MTKDATLKNVSMIKEIASSLTNIDAILTAHGFM